MSDDPIVYLVDDDAAMRESLAMLLDQAGFKVRPFPSADDFLATYSDDDPGCLVLDLRMPGMSGLELQETLGRNGRRLPIIFLSGFGNVPATVSAIRGGAVDFLEKPVSVETLVERIRQSLDLDRSQRQAAAEKLGIRELYSNLTPREREVMVLAIKGLANKEIARHLGISPRTVENHRARVMQKMQVDNIAELCQVAAVCLAYTAGAQAP
jgi:two-component system response regulator FixJ